MREVPLFPLHTVLFPGMLLPLHIFEPRYKEMVHHCITEKEPFGVVLIREGNEVGGGAKVFEIGTLAYITEVDQMDDGRINIASLGVDRFKIQSFSNKYSYLSGDIELYPFSHTATADAIEEAAKLTPALNKYLEILARIGNTEILLDKMPTEPEKIAFLTAIAMRAPMEDKQQLLSIPSLPDLLRQERALLTRETEILKMMTENAPAWIENAMPFSPN